MVINETWTEVGAKNISKLAIGSFFMKITWNRQDGSLVGKDLTSLLTVAGILMMSG